MLPTLVRNELFSTTYESPRSADGRPNRVYLTAEHTTIFFSFFFQCVKVLGSYKGVCRDDLIGGLDDNQLHTSEHVDGVSVVTYRRTLISCKFFTSGVSAPHN